jgi:hypothetical protein
MVPLGVETLVGVVSDRSSANDRLRSWRNTGRAAEGLSVRLSPVTRTKVSSILRELRSLPLLEGYRGNTTCDVAALEDVL